MQGVGLGGAAQVSRLVGTGVTVPKGITISREGEKVAPLFPKTEIVTVFGNATVPAPQSR